MGDGVASPRRRPLPPLPFLLLCLEKPTHARTRLILLFSPLLLLLLLLVCLGLSFSLLLAFCRPPQRFPSSSSSSVASFLYNNGVPLSQKALTHKKHNTQSVSPPLFLFARSAPFAVVSPLLSLAGGTPPAAAAGVQKQKKSVPFRRRRCRRRLAAPRLVLAAASSAPRSGLFCYVQTDIDPAPPNPFPNPSCRRRRPCERVASTRFHPNPFPSHPAPPFLHPPHTHSGERGEKGTGRRDKGKGSVISSLRRALLSSSSTRPEAQLNMF